MKTLLLILFLSVNCYAIDFYETEINGDRIVMQVKDVGNFAPSFRMYRWNEENYLQIKYSKEIFTKHELEENKLKLESDEFEIEMFTEGDNFKMILTFQSKPITNVFTFYLEGWENLRFEYQPIWLDDSQNEITTYTDSEGVHSRPDNVNGSYTVYHKTKKDHILGQTNYMAGKLFHIYRPKFTDANNNWVWAILSIVDGVYTVTIPQSFLDTAVYPIKANDTFGYTTIGGTTTGSTRVWALQASPSSSGDVTKITAYFTGATGDNGKAAIYEDGGSTSPTDLLAGSSEIALSDGWNDYTVILAVVGSTLYWLAAQAAANVNWHRDNNASANRGSRTQNYSVFPQDPFEAFSATANQDLSIYATYTPSAPPPPSVGAVPMILMLE